jgi:hypothetical protein
MDEQPTDSPAISDPAAALANIEDDESVAHEATLWAADELIEGRTPEQLLADLIEQGWEHDQAERIVETARKETRAQRGVVTRDDVAREMNADYRRATGGLSVAFRSGLFGLYGFTAGFMAALRSVRKLKAMVQRNRIESSERNRE